MTPAEAALVLTKASAYDSRTIGRADAEAWAEALDGLDPHRCIAAVVKHYRESTDRIMPAHVRRLVRTTTDLVRGEPSTGALLPGGNALCGVCKGVHGVQESCAVLKAGDTRWRAALAAGKAMPRVSRREVMANGGPRPNTPPREVPEREAAAAEAERVRQMAAMAKRIREESGEGQCA